ncbi:MAG: hypothetical protein EKK63_11540 [Acinetobacter sp.]|uniref:hypothetical protein n=1 Tax=Acinetobacter sp. TaxID=472 RepID=UPI000FAF5756|nr:hypothetical protein [Acinetobacter sp.]RUP38748.1 MAG: hypothetical protein EKK63_11540 [Acinetobacter sp.]
MAIYLTKEELNDSYYEASKTAKDWHKPFNEYERIAGNKLSKTLGKNMPRVNDGSLAASLLETPMQVYPVMQTGKFSVVDRDEQWLSEIANIIWRRRIVPKANTQASFFDKEQISIYRALRYGAQPRYNFFVSNETYTGSDWSLPYIRNVKLEPGKFSVDDCDYVFLDVFYTKLQLRKIIDQIEEDTKQAKINKTTPDTSWNVEALKQLVDAALTSKELDEQNQNEREKAINASGIKITACFQRGIGAPFYMFSKHLPDGECVREWVNPDPTGDLPITMQYCYENLESPYGIGRIELAGPTQNVLDYMTQAHVLATQIGLQPPKKISGPTDQTNFDSLQFAPDALWQTGQANIDVVQTTSGVYTQFPGNFGLYKAQLQNLQGRTDGSVSAQSGDPNFSKTSAGVKMQESRTNAQDNYLRNKADTAGAKMAEKMMNIHMAMMSGADLLEIAGDDLERLTKAGYFDDNEETPEPSSQDIPILYEELRGKFKFEFDPRPEADQDEKNRWLELIDIATSNPNVLPAIEQSGYRFNLGEAFKKVLGASGADQWEKVLDEISPEEIVPPQDQAQLNDELSATMQQYGIGEDVATAVLAARQQGYSEEEILNFLQGGDQ